MKKSLLLFPVVFSFMIGCQDKQVIVDLEAYKSQTEIEEFNKSVVQRYWDGKWNERRPEILDELLTRDIIHHGSSEIKGVEEYKQVYGMYLSAMGETQIKVEQLVAEGDRAVGLSRIKSIHNGPLGDIPPTGKEINVRGLTVFRLVDGKIAKEWEILDDLAMLTQLGFELVFPEWL